MLKQIRYLYFEEGGDNTFLKHVKIPRRKDKQEEKQNQFEPLNIPREGEQRISIETFFSGSKKKKKEEENIRGVNL